MIEVIEKWRSLMRVQLVLVEGSKSLIRVLADDAFQSVDELSSDLSNQFKRRAFVHFVFALIDGTISIKKQSSLSLYLASGRGRASERQIVWLKAKYDPALKENLKFALQTYAAITCVEFDLNLGGDLRWQSVHKAVGIRNRITHPKRVHDMIVSDEELDHVQQAFLWFSEKMCELHDLFMASRTLTKLPADNPVYINHAP